MRHTFIICALLALGSFSSATAQQAPVAPGTRVRVWTQTDAKGRPWGEPTEGRITVCTADSLVVDDRSPNGPLAIPLASVSRLDVSLGLRSRDRGALRKGRMGLLIGGATGAVFGFAQGDNDTADCIPWCFSADQMAINSAIVLGTTGAVIGAVIGNGWPGERWMKRVRVPGRVSISPSGRNSVAVSSGLRF